MLSSASALRFDIGDLGIVTSVTSAIWRRGKSKIPIHHAS
jgi:hypothetical protein